MDENILKDIFTFVKEFGVTFDITSSWFQDLWYPLSKLRPPQLGGPEKVNLRPKMPIIVTQNLLEWMGFKGRGVSDKQERFSRVLRSHGIPYNEIDYQHPLALEYPCVQKESEKLKLSFNLKKKKWICMDQRNFKKAVMRINTENADIVRDYYLNLEEAMFAYGEYTMNFLIEKTERQRKLKDLELTQMVEQLAIKDKSEEELHLRLEQEKQRADQEKQQREFQEKYSNKLRDIVTVMKSRQKDQIVYIATTKAYAKQNRFKVGGVKSRNLLKTRLSTYNSGRPVGDRMYYAYLTETVDYHHLEQRINKVIGDHKDSDGTEMYNLHYDSLLPLVEFLADRFDEEVEHHKALFENLIRETIEKTPHVPEPIIVNGAEYRKIRNGQVVATQLLDLDEMTELGKANFVKTVFEEFSVYKGSEDLVRKDFELYVANNYQTKFNKRMLWNLTKKISSSLGKAIKY